MKIQNVPGTRGASRKNNRQHGIGRYCQDNPLRFQQNRLVLFNERQNQPARPQNWFCFIHENQWDRRKISGACAVIIKPYIGIFCFDFRANGFMDNLNAPSILNRMEYIMNRISNRKILLIYTAAALVSTGALAQSDTRVYGLIDIGYAHTRTDERNAKSIRTNAIDSGNVSGSRWGVSGSEDLGNGLKAFFLLEGGFEADSGEIAQGGALFGRWAYLGLRGGFGEVRMGLHRNLGYDWGASEASPFGASWSNAAATRTLGYGSGDFGPNSGRLKNAVFYLSPTFAKGFQAGVGTSVSAEASESGSDSNNNRVSSVGLRYRNGAIRGALTYEKLRAKSGGSAKDASNLQLGLNYDFGFLRLYGAYGRVVDGNKGIFAGHDKVDSYTVGARVPVGKGSLLTSWQRARQAERDGYALGYLYPLSKRTEFYGFFSRLKDDDDTRKIHEDTRQISLGVMHRF
jgi:predicted porin